MMLTRPEIVKLNQDISRDPEVFDYRFSLQEINSLIPIASEAGCDALLRHILEHNPALDLQLIQKIDIKKYANILTAFAAKYGRLDVLQSLAAQHGIKLVLNTKAADHSSLLMIAAYFGQLHVVQWLVAQGADVDEKRKGDGIRPIMQCAIGGSANSVAIFNVLAGAGANIKAVDYNACAVLIHTLSADISLLDAALTYSLQGKKKNGYTIIELFFAMRRLASLPANDSIEKFEKLVAYRAQILRANPDFKAPYNQQDLERNVTLSGLLNNLIKWDQEIILEAARALNMSLMRYLIHKVLRKDSLSRGTVFLTPSLLARCAFYDTSVGKEGGMYWMSGWDTWKGTPVEQLPLLSPARILEILPDFVRAIIDAMILERAADKKFYTIYSDSRYMLEALGQMMRRCNQKTYKDINPEIYKDIIACIEHTIENYCHANPNSAAILPFIYSHFDFYGQFNPAWSNYAFPACIKILERIGNYQAMLDACYDLLEEKSLQGQRRETSWISHEIVTFAKQEIVKGVCSYSSVTLSPERVSLLCDIYLSRDEVVAQDEIVAQDETAASTHAKLCLFFEQKIKKLYTFQVLIEKYFTAYLCENIDDEEVIASHRDHYGSEIAELFEQMRVEGVEVNSLSFLLKFYMDSYQRIDSAAEMEFRLNLLASLGLIGEAAAAADEVTGDDTVNLKKSNAAKIFLSEALLFHAEEPLQEENSPLNNEHDPILSFNNSLVTRAIQALYLIEKVPETDGSIERLRARLSEYLSLNFSPAATGASLNSWHPVVKDYYCAYFAFKTDPDSNFTRIFRENVLSRHKTWKDYPELSKLEQAQMTAIPSLAASKSTTFSMPSEAANAPPVSAVKKPKPSS